MLARSSSGYPHYPPMDAFLEAFHADVFRAWPIEEVFGYGVASGPSFTPGTDWAFSDTSFLLLQGVLEKATGTTVAELMRTGIWEPLGMTGVTPPTTAAKAEPVLHGYSAERGVWEDATSWSPTWTEYAGGVAGNQQAMQLFVDAFASGSLVSAESHEAQLAPVNIGLGPNTENRFYVMGVGVVNGWLFNNPGLVGYHGAVGTLADEGWTVVIYTATGQNGDPDTASATTIFEALSAILVPDQPMIFNAG